MTINFRTIPVGCQVQTGRAPADLAPVDEFHARGREATLELCEHADFHSGDIVLDVGCGLGGSVRHIAAGHECEVTGIDLTPDYIEVARELANMVGLADRVTFQTASALDLPFENDTFDVAWTEHAQMNIKDKKRFFSEIARVLKLGGRLVFHDIMAGSERDIHFPVPWAEVKSLSFLETQTAMRAAIETAGLSVTKWIDVSKKTHDWLTERVAEIKINGAPPLGIHLLMGDTAPVKIPNVIRNLAEDRIHVAQGVASK